MEGKAQGAKDAVTGAVSDTLKAIQQVSTTVGKAAIGDAQAQQDLKDGAANTLDYLSQPRNWATLMNTMLGGMTSEQREELAQAYEGATAMPSPESKAGNC